VAEDLVTYEDIEPGATYGSGPITLSREAIVAFAEMYDPQPFHLDEAAAAASLLGGLAASGWQTVGVGMRLFFDGFVENAASMGSPGFDEVRWIRPVRPGDPLSLVLTIGAKRESSSRPDRGFVDVHLDVRNGVGESVMVQRGPVMVQKRGAVQRGRPRPHAAPVPIVPPPVPPADPMLAAPFDEVALGHVAALGTQLFTPELIIGYATLYDPQYFHLDAEAAKASHFGGLIASGWQTAAFWMKHYVAARARSTAAREAAGHTVTYGLEITGKRRIRDGWGMVATRNFGHAADGTLVFDFNGRLMWPIG
jgi:acyl dehydratase